jgi:hypothetical protein
LATSRRPTRFAPLGSSLGRAAARRASRLPKNTLIVGIRHGTEGTRRA